MQCFSCCVLQAPKVCWQPVNPLAHHSPAMCCPRVLFTQQNPRARTTVVCFTAVLEQAVHDYLASATDVDFPVDYDRNSKSHSRWSRVARTGLLAVVEHPSQVGGEGEQHVLASSAHTIPLLVPLDDMVGVGPGHGNVMLVCDVGELGSRPLLKVKAFR